MSRRATLFLVLGLLFAPLAAAEEVPRELSAPAAAPSAESKALSRPFIRATRKVLPSVVKILNYQKDRRGQLRHAQSGSGFIISSAGHVLTNRHVILGADQLVVKLDDGRVFGNVRKIGQDPRSDVGVLKIEDDPGGTLPVAKLGDSDALEVGEWVIAIGAPFQLASSVSVGVVSATGRTEVFRRGAFSEDFIQTDAALNPGNSGGPLVNLDGQVVGINTAIETGGTTRANAGIGFTIPINLARTIAASLIQHGVAKRGYLGIELDTRFYTATGLAQFGIRAQAGARIARVVEDSPADKAGLKAGDMITEVDGKPFTSVRIMHARLAQAGPGGMMELVAFRGKQQSRVRVQLGEERIASTLGIIVADLDAAKARELGIPADTEGVVVTNIVKNSIAGQAGSRNRLMPGDVIVRILWNPGHVEVIRNRTDFERVMARFQVEPPPVVRFDIRTKDGLFKLHLRGR